MPENLKHVSAFITYCLFLAPILAGLLITPTQLPIVATLDTASPSSPTIPIEFPALDSQSSNDIKKYHNSIISEGPAPKEFLPVFSLGNLLLLFGNFVNESSQEPVEAWETLFHNLGFDTTTQHLDNFSQSPDFDLIVVTPSVGTSNNSFGVTLTQAQLLGNCTQPILLLGYGHEVLDQLHGFNPFTDFIPSVERYLWSPDKTLQIFTLPHLIPIISGRFGIYSEHISYDAYRQSALPSKTAILGTNYAGSGSQLLWFRDYPYNSHIYYWGINRAENLNSDGWQFCENLLHWLIRPPIQQRLGATLAKWQLVSNDDYWAVQGAGGFGYPLEPSLRFSYYVVKIVETHGLPVNLSSWKSWLGQTYNSDLGCFEDLASPQLHDRCITTGMAVLMAEALGILTWFNQTRIRDYLLACQDTTSGGFFTELGSIHTSVMATHFAIESLAVLNQLPSINTSAVVDFIINCQELNPLNSEFGGFYSSASGGLSASLVYATDALLTLQTLDALSAINQSALLAFIAMCEEPVGSAIFDTKYTMDTEERVLGTACAIQLLDILGALNHYDTNSSRAYILDQQYPNGGWGRGDSAHDYHNSPDETGQSVRALALTGGLGPAETNLTNYLLDCCTPWGGATEPVIFGDFLVSTDIVLALWQIEAREQMNLSAFLSYLESCWSPTRTSFVAHQLPDIVGTDSDSPSPDRIVLEAGTFGPLYHYSYSQLITSLGLSGEPWTTRSTQIRLEIEACQTTAVGYAGMLGFHHLYVGHETDTTFRFDTTCWNLMAHQALGGQPTDLDNASAILTYLASCLQSNTTHQYFHDSIHLVPPPAPWREAEGYLTETWLGLQAYAYLDPSLSALDGDKLANYAISFLQENASVITTHYATEILFFLLETGLQPAALDTVDWTVIKSNLIDAFTFEGHLIDPSLPSGKWIPFLIVLGLQLVNRLQLLPHLDVNPILSFNGITYPTGILLLGENFTISASVIESRWGQLPGIPSVQTHIFGYTFLKSCNLLSSGYFELQAPIPISPSTLGPQNLSLIAFFPGTIPAYTRYFDICTGWGSLTLTTNISPSSTIPRSIPLSASIQLGLLGSTSPIDSLGNGTVSVTVTTTSHTYSASQQGTNQYVVSIPTQTLAPTNHILRINASIPYCSHHTETILITIVVFETHLTMEQIFPDTPVLFDPATLTIGLWNDSGIPLGGYQIRFNITRPGDTSPSHSINTTTDENGLAYFSWLPDLLGEWQAIFTFAGQDMYTASQNSSMIYIHRRSLGCTITLFPSSTLFVGNLSAIHIKVFDGLNSSLLPGLLINFYEDSLLLTSSITNETGEAICHWYATAPAGLRELWIEITGTATHEPWTSSPLAYLIQDTTTISISSNSTTLWLGETVLLDIYINSSASGPPNGTASIYLDGAWQKDVLIIQGSGTTLLPISYTELAGEHLVVVLFGHLETPDIYLENSAALFLTLRSVTVPTIILIVNPLEIDDLLLQPTIEIIVQLSYTTINSSHGLSANLTVQVYTQDAALLFTLDLLTNSSGFSQSFFSTPQPGLYSITVLFEGRRGFSSCSATTPFLVRYPYNRMSDIAFSLLLGSLAVMIIGFIIGIFAYIRLQRQLNGFLRRIQSNQNPVTQSQSAPLQSLDPLESETPSSNEADMRSD